MSVSDEDIELLEAHLDGELSSAAEAGLLGRLSTDHDLAAELSAIRADRSIRLEAFESCEPDDLAVKNLVLSVRKQITKDAVWGDRIRILRYIASAAAVIVLSFSAGWMGKSNRAVQNLGDQPQAVAQRDEAGSINFGGSQGGEPGVGTLASNMHAPQVASQQAGGYQVNLIDAFGRVRATQHFNTFDEASQFRADLDRWQKQQQEQPRTAETAVYKEQF